MFAVKKSDLVWCEVVVSWMLCFARYYRESDDLHRFRSLPHKKIGARVGG